MKPRLASVKNTLLAFATPIQQAKYDLPDFNREVATRVLALRDKSAGEKRSNEGGWHSDGRILQNLGEPYGKQLGQLFVENIRLAMESVVEMTSPLPDKVSIDAWANVNQRGDSNVPHIHGGCPWSGVYYVATEVGPDVGGRIFFEDPRTAALMVAHPFNPFNATNHVHVAPVAGMMLVFPSFIYHRVERYNGNSPRISIAFNLR